MSKKCTQYSSEFKAKVALAAIRRDETILQLAARYGIHPTPINSWRRQLIEQAAELFSKNNNANKESGQTTDDLHPVTQVEVYKNATTITLKSSLLTCFTAHTAIAAIRNAIISVSQAASLPLSNKAPRRKERGIKPTGN
jgi:transposase